jgi:hypothetical protein
MKKVYLTIIILFLFFDSFAQSEQRIDSIQIDTQLNRVNTSFEMLDFVPIEQNSVINSSFLNLQRELTTTMPLSFRLPNQGFLSNNLYGFTPYSYSFENFMEGVTIKGFNASYFLTDYLSANINTHISRVYLRGQTQLNPYINGTIRTQLILKLHDRVQLTGTGQISMREGINPEVSSLMEGANSYGAGIQFRLTNKIGIGAGFTNSYYRGNWSRRTHINPVGY